MPILRDKIIEYRKSKKLTRKKMASLLDCTEFFLYQIEKGSRQPGKKILTNFSKLANVSTDELLGIKISPPSHPASSFPLHQIPLFADTIPESFPEKIEKNKIKNWLLQPSNIEADFACKIKYPKKTSLLKRNVLIVDDKEIIQISINNILKDKYKTAVASSGEETIAKIKNEAFDVILLDIKMPGMSGIETLKELRKITPRTEVIMVTGLNKAKLAWEASKNGAFDYITKPFENENLLLRIEMAVKRRDEIFERDLPQNAIILCKQQSKAANGDIIIARAGHGNKYTINTYKKFKNQILLLPAIEQQDPIIEKKPRIIGKVTGILHKTNR